MANNEILQIVVFSVFFGVGGRHPSARRPRRGHRWIEQLSHVMLKVTGYVMAFAPIAVFAAMASIVATQGLGILLTYGKFMGEFYLGILLLWGLLALAGFVFLGPRVCSGCSASSRSRSCSPSARRAARRPIRRRSSSSSASA